MATFKGKVSKLALNQDVEKKNGDTFEAHKLKIELENGKGKVFIVSTKAKPAPYIEKLKIDDPVEITTGGKWDSVVKVFTPRSGNNKSGFKKPYVDNTEGQICGLVLKAALDVVLTKTTKEDLASMKATALKKEIVANAAIVLSARPEVDELVKQALKKKSDDGFDNDDSSAADEEDDQEESKPKKKSKKEDDFDDESESSDEDEAF